MDRKPHGAGGEVAARRGQDKACRRIERRRADQAVIHRAEREAEPGAELPGRAGNADLKLVAPVIAVVTRQPTDSTIALAGICVPGVTVAPDRPETRNSSTPNCRIAPFAPEASVFKRVGRQRRLRQFGGREAARGRAVADDEAIVRRVDDELAGLRRKGRQLRRRAAPELKLFAHIALKDGRAGAPYGTVPRLMTSTTESRTEPKLSVVVG